MSVSFQPSSILAPGGYRRVIGIDGRRTALIACPQCGTRMLLNPHPVDANGNVSPSVVCRKPCDFHEYIVLTEWGETAAQDHAA